MDDTATSHDALVFAMPFLQAIGPKNCERGMMLAVGCWNLSLLPPEHRAAEEAKILQAFDFAASWFPTSADGIQDIKKWMKSLIKRKLTKYAHRRRLIVTHTISFKEGTVTLTTGTVAVPEAEN